MPDFTCELPGCTSTGADKISEGRHQVYDGDQPTMTRPADICQTCLNVAKAAGLEPRRTFRGAC